MGFTTGISGVKHPISEVWRLLQVIKKTPIDVRVFVGRTTLESYTNGSRFVLQRSEILLDPGHE